MRELRLDRDFVVFSRFRMRRQFIIRSMKWNEYGKKKLFVQWIRFRNRFFFFFFALTRVAYAVLIIRFTIYREDLSFLIIVLKFILFQSVLFDVLIN